MGGKVEKPVFGGHEYVKCRVLGKGAFGKVYAVQLHADRSIVRAVKEMSKSEIVSRGQTTINLLLKERELLTELLGCPFVVRTYAATQDEKHLYLMLDFCSGGELDYHLSTMHHMSEEFVKIYAAEMVVALDIMHRVYHIVHRDLKPENVLLDPDGHIVIIDFNVAHHCNQDGTIPNPQKKSVGTIPYMAPEILSALDHGVGVDWWSFGILLYELRHGELPFQQSGTERSEMSRLINSEIGGLRAKIHGSEHFKDLIMGLLELDPSRRWTGSECKSCNFFSGMNWDDVKAYKLKTPIQPDKNRVNFKVDANIEEVFGINKVKEVPITDEQQEAFVDWNWESPDQNLPLLEGLDKSGKKSHHHHHHHHLSKTPKGQRPGSIPHSISPAPEKETEPQIPRTPPPESSFRKRRTAKSHSDIMVEVSIPLIRTETEASTILKPSGSLNKLACTGGSGLGVEDKRGDLKMGGRRTPTPEKK
eukprot:TRINITY_DN932_c2_g1_i2.p1 TRINITY_DN932_c2_g1~~TRINITY_DN932_c2_g1_i2.p1  ORF type:complete len:476 (+),score=104.10 TRINITY_DN932_c2_g1_i2:57-1484(+)